MKCTILTVGTEILFGQILNTNAAYLSQELQKLGVDVMYHMSCGDNPSRLKEMLAHAYHDCDAVITTGGLGPTQDDLTKEMICDYFGEKLVEFPEQLEILKGWFERYGSPMTTNNLKQARFPEHGTVLPNPNGTAPGFCIEKDGKLIYSLPGPPREMKPMFDDYVAPDLKARSGSALYYKTVKTLGIGESSLETELLPLIEGQSDPTLATYAADHECYLRVASKRGSKEEAEQAVEEMMTEVRKLIGPYIYSEEGEELADVVLSRMMKDGISLSCCESCTGGLFAKEITDRAGISAIFDRGIVAYSERAKMQELGVSAETLEKYGAVSEETAREMAEGLRRVSGSDMCISVTGYAGPATKENPNEPVGLYYIGLCYRGKCEVFRYMNSRPDRAHIRSRAVREMFTLMYKALFREA